MERKEQGLQKQGLPKIYFVKHVKSYLLLNMEMDVFFYQVWNPEVNAMCATIQD